MGHDARPDDVVTVHVDLDERSYPIHIGGGLLASAGQRIADQTGARQCAIITDENVGATHLDGLFRSLDAAGIRAHTHTLTPGEATKSYAQLETVLEALLGDGIERRDPVIALGGGVIGDLAGCAAGLLRRGVPFIQCPTSLLAQVDSSVGGKTGINSPHGKNLIGVFNQPALVLADTDTLATLSQREFRAGYAEVAKYGLLGDASFFSWLEDNWRAIFARGPELRDAIARSCEAKARIVAEDEREEDRRALLNLGHTFGHALEAATGYSDRLVHGEGVSIGMAMAFRFSARLGLIEPFTSDRATAHLAEVGLPTHVAQIPGTPLAADTLMTHIRQDKKVDAGALTFILVNGIGGAFVEKGVDPGAVLAFLGDELKQQ
ncbi:MAG: 3-dehydroquinate synthase [Pseudomonadota bacterium]